MNNQAPDYTSHHEGIEQALANLDERGMIEAIKTFKARRAKMYRDMIDAGVYDPVYYELLERWELA